MAPILYRTVAFLVLTAVTALFMALPYLPLGAAP